MEVLLLSVTHKGIQLGGLKKTTLEKEKVRGEGRKV